MRLDRYRLLEAIESGVRYALELDDEDYNEETVDFNKDKIKSRTNQEVFKEKVQVACDSKVFFPSAKDIIKQFNLIWKPKDKDDLKDTIKAYCEYYNDWTLDLNFIDVSDITDMIALFIDMPEFNGDISKWNVSNVTMMRSMFCKTKFNGDISNWDVSSVTNMSYMFIESKFNGDLSKWDVSNVTNMYSMFAYSKFNGDLSKWDVSNVRLLQSMFDNSSFSGDLSRWEINGDIDYMFSSSKSKNIKLDPNKIRAYNEIINVCNSYYKCIKKFNTFKTIFNCWKIEECPEWFRDLDKHIQKLKTT